jgi:hypothetical protein
MLLQIGQKKHSARLCLPKFENARQAIRADRRAIQHGADMHEGDRYSIDRHGGNRTAQLGQTTPHLSRLRRRDMLPHSGFSA